MFPKVWFHQNTLKSYLQDTTFIWLVSIGCHRFGNIFKNIIFKIYCIFKKNGPHGIRSCIFIRGPNLNIYKVTGKDPNHIKHQQLPTQLVKITIIFFINLYNLICIHCSINYTCDQFKLYVWLHNSKPGPNISGQSPFSAHPMKF